MSGGPYAPMLLVVAEEVPEGGNVALRRADEAFDAREPAWDIESEGATEGPDVKWVGERAEEWIEGAPDRREPDTTELERLDLETCDPDRIVLACDDGAWQAVWWLET